MKKNILIIVLVIVVAALCYFVWTKVVVAPTDGNVDEWGVFDPKTFTNEQYGFSFQYPADFEVGDERVNLPPSYEEFIPAKSLARKIPVEHCGLSGLPEHCTSFTYNPKITVAVVNGPLDTIAKEITKAIGEPIDIVKLGGHEFRVWTMGVEGEGVNQYFTKLSADLTLMLVYSYLDENMLISYKSYPGFWDLAKQKAVFESVASSLKVN